MKNLLEAKRLDRYVFGDKKEVTKPVLVEEDDADRWEAYYNWKAFNA